MTTSIIGNTVSPDLVITSPVQLEEAFTEWMRRYDEAPDAFYEGYTGDYGAACSNFLVDILMFLNSKAR